VTKPGAIPAEVTAVESDKSVENRPDEQRFSGEAEFNAKTQGRRRGAKKHRAEQRKNIQILFFAFLRLCVSAPLR
jgi:hypothetical protein